MKRISALIAMVFVAIGVCAAYAEEVVVFKGATILTVTMGTIENGIIVVRDGKIAALGAGIAVPAGARVIDCTGKFIMPGIIDAHSHISMDGGDTNEATSPVTAQVDMTDALIADDYDFYQALAGGVTAAKLMHGSANVIGGVNVTLKFKWGVPIRDIVIGDARPQIKMALGENPRRVYGDKNQMPATRPGVMAVARQSFIDAADYKQKWDDYRAKNAAGETATAPKRDLKLETLAKVLAGEIAIDCHAYSANEMESMLLVAKEFNLPLLAFSHAQESFKIRDEIAAAGVSVLGHTDWWGFKWEAYDGTPYALGQLVNAGVNTVIISDSGDVIRRLNREAAKVLKYNDLTADQALAMITINAAKALEIDKRTGSLEVGKDADLAIFDRHPLDGFSRCMMTVVEGKVQFDINAVKTALSR